jgi:hypothetical protein
MPRRIHTLLVAIVAVAAFGGTSDGERGQPPGEPRRPQMPRDADRAPRVEGTAVISGRVVVGDTGAPVRRARVVASGARRPHATSTDDLGRYQILGLSAGSYTVRVAKAGYVDAAFGQRRPMGPAVPLQLSDGQHLTRVDVFMARGGVITGHVRDEAGEPVTRARVSAQRFAYVRGVRQLSSAASDETDDRGQFRVFGLPPGEYFVSATLAAAERTGLLLDALDARRRGARPGQPAIAPQTTGYAPTYYPGTTAPSEAAPVRLGPSQELGGVDFQLQLVPLTTVRGTIAGNEGTVFLVSDDGRGFRSVRGSVRQDGTFAITDVAPGKYTLFARVEGANDEDRMAILPLVVTGEEVTVALVPVPGARLRGTVTVESAGTPPPATFQGFRVSAQRVDALPPVPRMNRPAQVADTGAFTLSNVLPGRYVIQASGARGWTMKAVFLGGREVTDDIVEIAGDDTRRFSIVFTDRVTTLAGAVRDAQGSRVAGVSVIVFPVDASGWRPQTRRIQTARTDQHGEYRIGQLPSGEYFVAAVEDVEEGEWFDPDYLQRISGQASRTSIAEGEQKRLDLAPPSASSTR